MYEPGGATSTVDGTAVSGWQVEVAPPGLYTGGVYESIIRPLHTTFQFHK